MQRLMEYLGVPSNGRVLDLACGKGRHSVELNRLGYQVVGIDLAEESIEEARKYETEELEFFVHDMRDLYWCDHFDAVVNLFTSFGYFHNSDDDQRTINSVRDALRPEGFFVLDFLNVQKVVSHLVAEEIVNRDGLRFHINRKLSGKVIIKDIRVVGDEIELNFKEEVDALTLEDFEKYFDIAGLEMRAVFGSYDLGPFDAKHSDRLILVAQKTNRWEI